MSLATAVWQYNFRKHRVHQYRRDTDPMVRGLALRSLCSLRLSSVVEYVTTPLRLSLVDTSSYVRKTGVLGVAKIFRLAPEVIKSTDLVDTLYGMLRDRDAVVVSNVIVALQEIMQGEGGMAINQPIIHHLLNRIKDFSEWGQVSVLDLVTKYAPANDQELFGIMNLLDPCLRASNAAVVLATTKCFITYTATRPAVLQQVFTRLKTPLLTLVATATQETGYVVLKHVETIVERAPTVFDSEFKQFFCKYSDPPSVQKIKLRILPMVADDSNTPDIVSELSEYVSGVDSDIASAAVRAIGDIALRVHSSVDTVIATLLEVLDLDLDADWVRSQTVIVMQTLLRRHPSRAPSVIPALHKALTQVTDAEGRAAVVWMIGEYGDMLDDAPYMLEPLIDATVEASGIGGVGVAASGDAGEEVGTLVKLELLTSTLKLFFKRPPEVKGMLGRLLKATLEAEEEEAAVRDRALLYYRLLRTDPAEAAAVVGATGDRVAAGAFLPDMSAAEKDAIFSEFNSLSVVYDRRASAFIADKYLAATVAPSEPEHGAADASGATEPGAAAVHTSSAGGDDLDDLLGGAVSAPAPAPAPAAAVPATVGDFDEFDLLGGAVPAPAPAPGPVPAAASAPIMTPDTFKAKWAQLAVSASAKFGLQPPGNITGDIVKQALTAGNLRDVAAGDTGSHVKFFVVGSDSQGAAHLVELVVAKAATGVLVSDGVQITVKSSPGGDVAGFATALRGALLPLGLQ